MLMPTMTCPVAASQSCVDSPAPGLGEAPVASSEEGAQSTDSPAAASTLDMRPPALLPPECAAAENVTEASSQEREARPVSLKTGGVPGLPELCSMHSSTVGSHVDAASPQETLETAAKRARLVE